MWSGSRVSVCKLHFALVLMSWFVFGFTIILNHNSEAQQQVKKEPIPRYELVHIPQQHMTSIHCHSGSFFSKNTTPSKCVNFMFHFSIIQLISILF